LGSCRIGFRSESCRLGWSGAEEIFSGIIAREGLLERLVHRHPHP
jgi:hypothetical protein